VVGAGVGILVGTVVETTVGTVVGADVETAGGSVAGTAGAAVAGKSGEEPGELFPSAMTPETVRATVRRMMINPRNRSPLSGDIPKVCVFEIFPVCNTRVRWYLHISVNDDCISGDTISAG